MGEVVSEVLQSAAFGVAFALALAGIALVLKAESATWADAAEEAPSGGAEK